jgi:ribosomal protein S18 acetylase RimI-like enzyme
MLCQDALSTEDETMATPLDNPIWHALIGPHARHAIGRGAARRYPPEIAPFAAIAEASAAAYADLAADVPPNTNVMLFRPEDEPLPEGWQAGDARWLEQMVLASDYPLPELPAVSVVPLGVDDAADMLALVEVAKPGPFARRTVELGGYAGVRDPTGQLIAMAGERLRLPGFVELSAVCVHPDARGQGLGAAMSLHVARAALARGEVPFLHVWPDNPAKALYDRIGFRLRAKLRVLSRRPIAV